MHPGVFLSHEQWPSIGTVQGRCGMKSAIDIPAEERLLKLAASGDPDALGQLLESYRKRLEHIVRVRLDHRLQSRMNASDVIQETYIEAGERLTESSTSFGTAIVLEDVRISPPDRRRSRMVQPQAFTSFRTLSVSLT